MNEENTKKLFEDFPELYRGRNEPLSKNLMGFGFSCDDGWFQLIYDLSKKINEECPSTKAIQVKEKFGTLRFYAITQLNKRKLIYKLIYEAESKSRTICEICGTDKNVKCKSSTGSCISTLCEKCREENEENKRKG